jgi:hypothetical protein
MGGLERGKTVNPVGSISDGTEIVSRTSKANLLARECQTLCSGGNNNVPCVVKFNVLGPDEELVGIADCNEGAT